MSVKNLPYEYYSLPYCRPDKVEAGDCAGGQGCGPPHGDQRPGYVGSLAALPAPLPLGIPRSRSTQMSCARFRFARPLPRTTAPAAASAGGEQRGEPGRGAARRPHRELALRRGCWPCRLLLASAAALRRHQPPPAAAARRCLLPPLLLARICDMPPTCCASRRCRSGARAAPPGPAAPAGTHRRRPRPAHPAAWAQTKFRVDQHCSIVCRIDSLSKAQDKAFRSKISDDYRVNMCGAVLRCVLLRCAVFCCAVFCCAALRCCVLLCGLPCCRAALLMLLHVQPQWGVTGGCCRFQNPSVLHQGCCCIDITIDCIPTPARCAAQDPGQPAHRHGAHAGRRRGAGEDVRARLPRGLPGREWLGPRCWGRH